MGLGLQKRGILAHEIENQINVCKRGQTLVSDAPTMGSGETASGTAQASACQKKEINKLCLC
jgi:hypothetical protein